MKHALQQESKARQRAENRYAEEQRLRLDLERKVAALQMENTALNAERAAQLASATEILFPLVKFSDFSPITHSSDNPVLLTETEGIPPEGHELVVHPEAYQAQLQAAMTNDVTSV